MKKVLCALAVASIAAPIVSAQAMTLYEKDGLKYKMKGDWQIQLRQKAGEDKDLDVEYDDLEIKNNITYDLGNGLRAIGELDFGFKKAADESDDDERGHLEEAYLGFGYENFEFVFGKTDSATDEFGIEGAIESPLKDDVFDKEKVDEGDDLLKVSAEFADMVTVIVSHELDAESSDSSENGGFTDIFASVEFSGCTIGAAYSSFDTNVVGEDRLDLYGVSIAYDAKVVEVGADYSVVDDPNKYDYDFLNIYVGVPVKSFKIGAGFQQIDYDTDAKEDVSAWYANVTYKFPAHKNVSVFAEIQDTDEDNSDMGYLVGARIKF